MAKFKKALVGSPLNDGTTGRRYSWGLWRKRKAGPNKSRYGIQSGPTMLAIHAGLPSLYIEKKNPTRYLHNFGG